MHASSVPDAPGDANADERRQRYEALRRCWHTPFPPPGIPVCPRGYAGYAPPWAQELEDRCRQEPTGRLVSKTPAELGCRIARRWYACQSRKRALFTIVPRWPDRIVGIEFQNDRFALLERAPNGKLVYAQPDESAVFANRYVTTTYTNWVDVVG